MVAWGLGMKVFLLINYSIKAGSIKVSLKQRNILHRELTSSRFISSFKNIRKPGTY